MMVKITRLAELSATDYCPDITFFLPCLSGGGVEKHFLKLMDYMLEMGLKVDLILLECNGEQISDVPAGVRIVDFESRSHRDVLFMNIKLLIMYLRSVQPAILHSAVDKVNVIACFSKKFANVKTKLIVAQVSSIDLMEISWFKPTRILHYLMVRISFPLADGFITPSHGIADQIKKLPFIGEKPVTGIHNPLLFELPSTDYVKSIFLDGIPTVLAAGRLSPEKDYPTLLQAFALVRKNTICRLYIIGEGAERQKLESLADKLGIQNDVTFAGYVKNPLDYMREADVFVLSSVKEGFGLVVLEALAVGTKVVSTDCKHGPSEILDYGRFGRLVPIKNPRALAEAIEAALKDPAPTEIYEKQLQEHIGKFEFRKHAFAYLNALGLKFEKT